MNKDLPANERVAAQDATGPWYAECESGHPLWTGPEHDDYEGAQADATAHDNARHGGAPTAVVLN